MELLKYTGYSNEFKSSELMDEGYLHLPGIDEHDSETLCGISWSGATHVTIDGTAPTCPACISITQEIFRRYSKKQAASWIA